MISYQLYVYNNDAEWSIVDEIIRDEPAQQKWEESVHEMILKHVLRLHHLLIRSQKLEHVHKTHQRACHSICGQSPEAGQSRECDEDSKQEAENFLDVEENVGDLLLAVLSIAAEGAREERAFIGHSWIIFDNWNIDVSDIHVYVWLYRE